MSSLCNCSVCLPIEQRFGASGKPGWLQQLQHSNPDSRLQWRSHQLHLPSVWILLFHQWSWRQLQEEWKAGGGGVGWQKQTSTKLPRDQISIPAVPFVQRRLLLHTGKSGRRFCCTRHSSRSHGALSLFPFCMICFRVCGELLNSCHRPMISVGKFSPLICSASVCRVCYSEFANTIEWNIYGL